MLNKKSDRVELVVVIIGRVTLSLSGVLLIVVLLNVLDAREYSLYVFLFSSASWLSAILFVSTNIPFLNFVSNSESNNSLPSNSIKNIALTLSIYSFPFAIGISTVGAYAILYFFDKPEIQLSIALCLSIGVLSAAIGSVNLASIYLMGKRRRLANTITTSGFIILRVGCVFALAFLITAAPTAVNAFYAATFAGITGFFLAITIAFKPIEKPNPYFTKQAIRENRLGLAYVENWPVSVGNNVFLYGDKVFLAFLLPIEAIGIISIYQQFCRMVANVTSGAIYQFIAPILLNTSEKKGSIRHFSVASISSFAVYTVVAIPAYIALLLVNTHLLQSKFTTNLHEYILVVLTIGLTGASRITELNFFKQKAISLLHWPMALSIFSFFLFSYFLASHYGMLGALYAMLIAAAVRLICTNVVQSTAKISIE